MNEEIIIIDKFEVFYVWYKWWKARGGMHYYGWGDGEYILEGLRNDPVKVIKLGRLQGWWEERIIFFHINPNNNYHLYVIIPFLLL